MTSRLGILYVLGVYIYFTGIVSMVASAVFLNLLGAGMALPNAHSGFWYPTSIAILGLLLMCAGLVGGSKRGKVTDAKSAA